jgi:Tol biopolymer transport system component
MSKYINLFIVFNLFLITGCAKYELISSGEIFKNLTPITFGDGVNISPAVNKEGTKIIYASQRDGNYNIYLKNNPLEKSEVKKTNHAANSIDPCFSPDGTRFCYASNQNGNYDIYIMNTEKGFTSTQITNSENDELSPNWSPNGELIIFAQYSNVDQEWYIWTKNLTNGQLTQICKGTLPVFAPDGKTFYYKKIVNDSYFQLFRIELDGENDTQITDGKDWGVGTYCISPNGKKVLFSTAKYNIESEIEDNGLDLWALDLNSGDLIQITTYKGSDYYPAWSSLDDIYFVSDRMGKTNIWSFKANF